MEIPKIKLKSKKAMGVETILSIVLVVFILGELYYAFNYAYTNFLTKPAVEDNNNIVHLDSQGYHDTINYLDNLNNFVPDNPTPNNPNPFK